MITVTVGLLKENKLFIETLRTLMKVKEMEAKEKWKLYDVIKVCDETIQKMTELMNGIIEKYSNEQDENRRWINESKMTPEQVKSFNEEYLSFINTVVELPIDKKIVLSDKVIDNFTVEDLIVLEPIIERP